MKRHTKKARASFIAKNVRKLELAAIAFVVFLIILGIPDLADRCESADCLPLDCQCQMSDSAGSAFNLSCDCLASPSS